MVGRSCLPLARGLQRELTGSQLHEHCFVSISAPHQRPSEPLVSEALSASSPAAVPPCLCSLGALIAKEVEVALSRLLPGILCADLIPWSAWALAPDDLLVLRTQTKSLALLPGHTPLHLHVLTCPLHSSALKSTALRLQGSPESGLRCLRPLARSPSPASWKNWLP